MKRQIILMWVMVSALAINVQADITIFDSNAMIVEGNLYDTVVVKGDNTVVEMTGGDANKVILMDASTFNMSGGNINYVMLPYDSSTLNSSGGYIELIMARGESKINITGNASLYHCDLYDSTTMTCSSNTATISKILLYCHSTLDVSDGLITYVHAHKENKSKLNINGGHISSFYVMYDCVVNISGGSIDNLLLDYDWTEPEINIIGYDLTALPYGGAQGYGEIRGWWNDHTYFTIDLGGVGTYSRINLYDGIIPPNCAYKPDSDLSGDCKVNFIDLSKMASEWLDCGLDPNDAC